MWQASLRPRRQRGPRVNVAERGQGVPLAISYQERTDHIRPQPEAIAISQNGYWLIGRHGRIGCVATKADTHPPTLFPRVKRKVHPTLQGSKIQGPRPTLRVGDRDYRYRSWAVEQWSSVDSPLQPCRVSFSSPSASDSLALVN